MNEEQRPELAGAEDQAGPPDLTEEAARKALGEHLNLRALAIRAKYGGEVRAETILQILADSDAVRYPVELQFSAKWLEPGEFGFPQALDSEDPGKGFVFFLHPFFQDKMGAWPALIAYHIPTINYGSMPSADEAELYGATLLGMELDDYYDLVCELVDAMANAEAQSDESGSTSIAEEQ